MDRRTTKGRFFLNENNSITFGDLKWSQGCAYIELYSSPKKTMDGQYHEKYLYGILDGQHAVTIFNCNFRRFSFPMNDFTVDFDYLVRGYGTEWNKTETSFLSYRAYFNHLQDWVNIKGLETVLENNEWKIKRNLNQKEIIIFESEVFTIKLQFETSLPIFNQAKNYTATQNTFLEIKVHLDQDFDRIFDIIDKLGHLLTLISGNKFIQNDIIDCRDSDNKNYHIVRNFPNKWNGLIESDSDTNLLSFNELKSKIDPKIILDKFLKLNDDFLADVYLLSSCIDNESMPHHYKFLNLMYILDRICGKESKESFSEVELSTNDITHLEVLEKKGIHLNTINYLKSRLIKTNYGKLKERFRMFLSTKDFIMSRNSNQIIEDFVEITVNTRNSLAHGTLKEPILNEVGLETANDVLLNWLSLIVLNYLGIESIELNHYTTEYRT